MRVYICTYGIYKPTPSSWVRIAHVGPKAPNMQEYAHFTPNATPFTCAPHSFTRGLEELQSVVCGHCLPQVDAVC